MIPGETQPVTAAERLSVRKVGVPARNARGVANRRWIGGHSVAKKVKVPRKWLVVAAGIMVPGVLAASTVAASHADAATTPLQVTLYACGTGSSAVWNSTPDPVLKAGTASPGTCGASAGSTYNPANARLGFNGTFDSAVPATEPAFKASAYSTGTPRMVIGLLNGKTLGASGHGDRLLLRSGGPPRLHRHVHARGRRRS